MPKLPFLNLLCAAPAESLTPATVNAAGVNVDESQVNGACLRDCFMVACPYVSAHNAIFILLLATSGWVLSWKHEKLLKKEYS